jgi:hypothetical protein
MPEYNWKAVRFPVLATRCTKTDTKHQVFEQALRGLYLHLSWNERVPHISPRLGLFMMHDAARDWGGSCSWAQPSGSESAPFAFSLRPSCSPSSIQPDFTMSQVPSSSTSSTNFEAIFAAALKTYNKQTKKDIDSHPLATQLKSCDSSSAILAVLRTQVQTFEQSQGADEKLTKWLDPTVNVLLAFSVTLGNGVGVVIATR